MAVFRKGAGVPEFREDATDDGFHEIQLSRKQLVFLFMTGSVALILVFLFGVVVGRDTATKPVEQSIATADAPPPAADPSATPTDPPEPRSENPATPETSSQSKPLSYPEELGKAKPPADQNAAAPPPAPVADPQPPVATPKQPEAAASPEPGLKVPTSGRPGAWVIQVSALRSREAAAEWVQKLITKGYPAFLDDSAPGVFRVRIGRFKDRNEAERFSRRLLKEESTKSVISR